MSFRPIHYPADAVDQDAANTAMNESLLAELARNPAFAAHLQRLLAHVQRHPAYVPPPAGDGVQTSLQGQQPSVEARQAPAHVQQPHIQAQQPPTQAHQPPIQPQRPPHFQQPPARIQRPSDRVQQPPAPPASDSPGNIDQTPFLEGYEAPAELFGEPSLPQRTESLRVPETRNRDQRPVTIRQRRQKPSIEYGVLDFSKLHDPSSDLRPHPPVPEDTFASYDECVRGYEAWARDHGLAYVRKRWLKNAAGDHYKCSVYCVKAGKRKAIEPSGRRRPKSQSIKTDCPFCFYIVAVDYHDPHNSAWRILHMTGQQHVQKSLLHNHPPLENIYDLPKYRQEWKTQEVLARIQSYFPTHLGARQVLVQLQKEFPGIQLTSQDVRNQMQRQNNSRPSGRS